MSLYDSFITQGLTFKCLICYGPWWVGLVVSVPASHTVGREFASWPGHTKNHHENGTNCPPCMARNALELEFGSATRLSKRLGSVWICLWGHALKRSPGINRKSRVSYPGPGFLSSATWPSLPKKHYNGLNQTKPFVTVSTHTLQV